MKDFNPKDVSYRFEDFIGVFENVFTEFECEHTIKLFERYHSCGFTYKRNWEDNKSHLLTQTNDTSIHINASLDLDWNLSFILNFKKRYEQIIYPLYMNKYPMIQSYTKHSPFYIKIQKTEKSQGFHQWHFEHNGHSDSKNRLFAWILYLNDIEMGGETEFLYQSIRVQPKKGTFVLFPAGFTHTHRGNPPLKGVKYLATGWIEFNNDPGFTNPTEINLSMFEEKKLNLKDNKSETQRIFYS